MSKPLILLLLVGPLAVLAQPPGEGSPPEDGEGGPGGDEGPPEDDDSGDGGIGGDDDGFAGPPEDDDESTCDPCGYSTAYEETISTISGIEAVGNLMIEILPFLRSLCT